MIHPVERARRRLHKRRLAHRHPGWCMRERWHDKGNDRDWGRQIHGATIGHGWLEEIRAKSCITLPWRGEWTVEIRQDEWSASDATVQLEISTEQNGHVELDLLRSEARELGAALIAAADRLGDQTLAWPT